MKYVLKGRFAALAGAALVFICAGSAWAAPDKVTVTAATGGSAISADNTGGTWTTLTNPIAAEANPGNIGLGTIILNAPSGFLFNAGVTVTVLVTSAGTPSQNINGITSGNTFNATVAGDGSTITANITSVSTVKNTLTWQNIQVRPTAGTPLATGNITTNAAGTSIMKNLTLPAAEWGTLTEVAGSAAKMMITLGGQTFTNGTGNVGSPTNQTAGNPFNIPKLTATDQFTNTASTYSGSKTISYSGPGGVATYTTNVSFTSGQSTTTLATTLKKAETTAITATDGTLTGVPSSSLTVNPGILNKLQVLVPSETAAPGTTAGKTGTPDGQTAGVAFSVTVNAVDANFNLISTNDTVHFTSTDANATLPSDTALSGGTGSFSVTLKTAGTKTVTASDVTHSGVTAGASAGITVSAATAALVRVETASNGTGTTVPPQTVPVGGSITVYAISRDAFSNFLANVAADSWSLVNITGGVVSGDLLAAGDSKSATFTGHAGGSAAIHADSGSLTPTDSGTLTVTPASTTTTLASSANPSASGQPITFTATVTVTPPGSGTPSGTVTFKDGATALATNNLSGGVATFTVGTLSTASHSMTAVYNGDDSFNPSTSATLTQTVNKAATTTALASSQSPTVFGQSVTLTATVTANSPGAGTPTGTVTFKDGVSTLNSSALNLSGQATLTTASLSPGLHSLTAVYSGDGNFNTSTNSPALSQTVSKAGTTTTLSASTNSSVFGEPVIFTAIVGAVAPGAGTPTGTVTLKDGLASLATNSLSAGQVSFTNTSLPVASHTLTAVYNGDANFNTNTSGALTNTVSPADTATTLASSVNPSVYGQPVIFTATVAAVAPSGGTPTGTVTLMDGPSTLDTRPLTAGQAKYTNSTLSVGSHTITAVYSGSSNFNGSDTTNSPINQIINQASTTTTVASSANPSVWGQSVTFTATVSAAAPGSGTPTGTVQFLTNGVNFGSPVPLSGGVALSAALASLAVTNHTITAIYIDDPSFAVSDNSASPLIQSVTRASTSTTVISSVNPSLVGQEVTLTATVAPAPPGSGTPTGTVTFKDGTNPLATNTLVSGQATLSTSAFLPGSHSITAVYNDDACFNPSTSAVTTQIVNKLTSTTTVNSSANPSAFGQSVTFTATVTETNSFGTNVTPTGTVTFKDGATALATNSLTGGQAAFSTASLATGPHSITAVYGGDASSNPSTNSPALGQSVNKANTTATLAASTNQTIFGQSVIFTAAVTAAAPGSGTPTGTVIFKDGATALRTNTLSSGQSTYTNSTLTVGSHSITVVYNGDANFNTNTSDVLTQTVTLANTTTTVASSTNPSVFGQSVTFTATVSAVPPAGGARTGTVQFSVDGSPFGSPVTLSGSNATLTTTLLAVGDHTVTAAYSGDANFNGSDSTASPLTQTVNRANTTTTVTSSTNPVVFGQSVTFTATVTAAAPGSGTPSGTVSLFDGVTSLGFQFLDGSGQATFPISTLSVGAHSITAVYNAGDNFNGSTSAVRTQTVNQASTTTSLSSSANPSVVGQSVTFTAHVNPVSPGAGTPSGTVTFKDGGTVLNTNGSTLSSGQATFTTSALSIGQHLITAVYSGDPSFLTNTSIILTQQVNKATSTTSVTSSTNPSDFGQCVIFMATVSAVAPGGGTPTGTVIFKDGASSLATNNLSGGSATYTNCALSIGSHSITAVYSGDSNFNPSTSATLPQTVNKSDTTPALVSSPNPSVFGQSVTFTAMVSAAATGTVTFNDGPTPLSTNTLSSGQATFVTSVLSATSHSITVTYNGDANFNPNTSAVVTQIVNLASSATVVTSSAQPSVFGQSVTFTATVSAASPSTGTPTGSVTFQDGTNLLGTATLAGGLATFTTNSLSLGSHSITATYAGDSNFTGSDDSASPFTQTVNQDSTSTGLSASPDPSVFGQSVTFTATVTANAPGSGTPTGTVTFKDGTNILGTGILSVGLATFTTNGLSVASHPITAVYAGDGNYTTSTSASLAQLVNKSATTVALTSAPNPSVFSQPVVFTASVTAASPGAGTPTGTVTFKDGPTTLDTRPLSSGSVTYTNSTLSATNHSITAVYSGDSNFMTNTSSALTQTVSKPDTTVTLTSSTNPTVFGQSVVFSATVAVVSPGTGTPIGTVTFKDGATALSTNTLSAGQVSYNNSVLVAGSHSITVVYNGDPNFNTNTSGVLTQTVNQADTTIAVTTSLTPTVFGQPVTFTATVSPVSPGGGTPTGTVTFQDGTNTLGTGTLNSGSATLTNSSLVVGAHSITAVYNDDANFNSSDSSASPLTQTVNPANSTTTLTSSTNPTVFGQSVTFTATVTATAPGSGTPTGTVTFKDGGVPLATNALDGTLHATFTLNTLSTGSHSITATYNADSNFNTSTSVTLTQTVNKANSTTAVVSSGSPSVSGQSVVLTATVSATAPGSGTPTGTVVFKDGGVAISTNTLSAGQSSYTNTTLSVTNHSITVAYLGDLSFNTNLSATVTQTVNKASSATTVTSLPNPSVFGQSVTFTATVGPLSPAGGTPTGSVVFKDGAIALATTNLSGGTATYSTSTLSVTNHSITVAYLGDSSFNTNISATLTQIVNKADSIATLTSNTNPSVSGQSVVFTATVSAASPGAGTPTGTVTFKDGASTLNTSTLNSGTATYTNSTLSAASHSITVVYNGDANFNTNTSVALTQTVNQASTTTTVSSSGSPSVFGQPVTFTATVNPVAPGAGTRTGTVQFSIDGLPFGGPVSLVGSNATSATNSSLSVSNHSITAAYSGDSNFTGSDNTSAPFTQTVNPANTATTLSSSTNPTVFGQSVTFTATVTASAPGSGTPTGTVIFKDGGVPLATNTLSSGQVTFVTSVLSVALHPITATYNTDGNFNSSTSGTLTQTVNKASSTTTVVSSQNPSVFGQAVTFTATVTAASPGTGTPTGNVIFKDGSTALATNTLSAGSATYTVGTLSTASHSITVAYTGDPSFNTNISATLTQTVSKADSIATLTSSTNPTVFGQSVVFTATVAAASPGSGTPTGTVIFKDGATALSTNTLSGGSTTYTNSTLSVTSHSLTALYNGDAFFNTNTSGVLTQTVNQADTTTMLTSSTNPSVFGQSVVFTATVTPVAPGSGTPTGSVVFQDGLTALSTNSLVSGQAKYTNSTLSVNAHTITAVYNGSSNFTGSDSTASPLTQTVNPANSTTTLTSSTNPSVFGQSVTFTATVTVAAPGSGTPTGTVTFKDGGVPLATNALSGSSATFSTSTLSVSSHPITATYNADSNFNASTSGTVTQTVNKANSSTALASSANPSVSGQPVVFTATVSATLPGSGIPGGSVVFKDGALALATNALSGGSTSYTNSSLSVATHSITAAYTGDASFNTNLSSTVSQVVSKANTTTAVSSSTNPSVFGQPVTFTATVSAASPSIGTPTGSVVFKDGATALATNNLSAGTATYTNSTLSVTNHSITVAYTGDPNFNTNISATLTQTVSKADSIATLTSSTNPSVFGQSVIFTATVSAASPGAGIPAGTVTFKDGATALSTNTLSGGSVAYTNSALSVTSHSLTVVYSGDANFNTDTSDVLTQTVNQASSTTTVASSAQPSVFGQSVTFTATVNAVSPGAGTRTGMVQFSIDGSPFGGPVSLVGSNATSAATNSLSVGPHTVTAVYSGDSNFTASDNTAAPLTQTVSPASSTSTVVSSANPSVSGQTVIFTATVSAVAPGAGTPTGTVTLKDGAATLGIGTLSSGQVTLATASLSQGAHSITAVYGGDGNFNPSTSLVLTQTVNKASTSVALVSSPNPSVVNQPVVFTATVSPVAPGSGTPTGTVTFKEGATPLGTNALNAAGEASYTNAALAAGSHSITALYSGDSNFNTNTSAALTQAVNKQGTTTTLASSQNPSVFGQSVSFTATVTATNGTPTGTVTFKDGATALATNSLSGGVATFTVGTLSTASHSMTAVYNGDAAFNSSTNSPALSQTVNKADTTATLTSSTNPTVFGQSIVFTATVNASAPGAGTPSGTVTFKDGATALSTNTLTGGSVTYTNSTLSPTSHSVTAVYNGDSNFNTSTSGTLTQTVGQATSTTTVASSAQPSVFGQSVTFTATVNPVSPGAGTRTGTVQFSIDGSPFGGAVTLSGGAASITNSSLSVSNHSITAAYSGDINFTASDNSASPFTQTVNKGGTTTAVTSSSNPSVVGQPVSFTATVGPLPPAGGTPTGTVQFTIDGSNFGSPVTLSAGSASSSTTNSLTQASHTITAVYSGDTTFSNSTSANFTQTVTADPVAAATGGTGISADNATNGATPGFTTLGNIVYLEQANGDLPVQTSTTLILTAPAGWRFNPGVGSASATKSGGGGAEVAINSISVTSSNLTLNITVSGTGQINTLTISGLQVQATEGGNVPASANIYRATGSAGGTATVTGIYTTSNADGSGGSSFAALSQAVGSLRLYTVLPGRTFTDSSAVATSGLSGTPTAQTAGTPFNLTALIAADRQFNISSTYSGAKTISYTGPGGAPTYTTAVTFTNGQSSNALVTTLTKAETTTITATDGTVAGVATMNFTVNAGAPAKLQVLLPGEVAAAGTTAGKTGSPTPQSVGIPLSGTNGILVNAVDANWNVTTTSTPNVTIISSDAAAVISDDNGVTAGNLTLVAGTGTLSNFVFNTVGTQTITGTDAASVLATGTSSNVTVNPVATTTTLASSQNPSVSGQSVTFTAAVSAGAGTPTGTVTFKDGTNSLGTNTLDGSLHATFTTSALAAGAHSITATYNGSASYNPSTSATLTQNVVRAPSTTTLTSSTNPTVFGQSVTFTATISGTNGTPTGSVTLKDGTNSLATNALTGGVATLTVGTLSTGSHSMTALYSGDAFYNTSSNSPALTNVVNKADVTATLISSTNPTVFGQSVTFTATIAAVSPGSGTPSGTVTFKDGATSLSTNTLSGGSATYSTSTLSATSHSLTATYNGDTNFNTNTSSVLAQTVTKSDTTTTLASSANPSVFGQSVIFTATVTAVAPGSGAPTGSVVFQDGTNSLATNSLVSGSATYTNSTLSVTSHLITAIYSGSTNFNGSDTTASPITQVVNKATTTTTVASSASPSVSGQAITFTATVNAVAPGAGARTGTVQFRIDGSDFGTPVSLVGSNATSAATNSLSVGTHTVTAIYSGDGNFNASDNTAAPLTQTVNGTSTTTLTASTNTTVFGQSVTFTATVSGTNGTPTGTVIFKDGTTALATNSLGSGVATYSTSTLSVTSHSMTAVYSGDGIYASSTNTPPLTNTVIKADTTTALTSSTNPAVFGQAVVFTATVTATAPGAGTPTGTVVFKDGITALRTNILSGGSATYTNSTLSVTSHSVTVVYNGDANFNTNTSSTLAQTVNAANTTTTITSSTNPAVFGQAITFTATVHPVAPGAGTRTGTVQFVVDGLNFGSPVALSGSNATSAANSSLSVGAHTVAAIYSGDTNFNASTSTNLAQTVNKANTTTTVASSANPSFAGDPVTFTATVNPVSPGAGTRTGTVQFTLDGTNFDGAVTLSGSNATIVVTSFLTAASHTVTAAYSGDANFNTSTSSTLTQTVSASPITPATGGTNISADATVGSYTNLSGPSYQEPTTGDVSSGDIVLNAPTGFVFNAGATVTVLLNGDTVASHNLNGLTNGATIAASVTTNTVTIHISTKSTGNTPNKLTWQGLQVRPSAGTPLASGIVTKSGGVGLSTMAGVTDGVSTFGALTEVPGAAVKLAFTTQPGSATYGSLLSPQPVLRSQDQFGNNSAVSLGASKTVTLTLTGSPGSLVGSTALDLGTNAGNGSVTFTNLQVTAAGTNNQLTAAASGLASAVSSNFVINAVTVTPGITASNKVYDATNAAAIATRSLTGVIGSDDVTLAGGSAHFSDKTVGNAKTVTATNLTLHGTTAPNYVLSTTTATTTANITAAGLTVSGITANSRVYNATTNATLNTGGATLLGVLGTDNVTLSTATATGAFANKTVGTNKTVSISGLTTSGSDAINYQLTQPSTTASISSANLTVTGITADNKAYDGTTNATLHTSGTTLVGVLSGDSVTLITTNAVGYFADPNIGTNKTVLISGLTITGPDAINYQLTQPTTTANIANAGVTVAGISASDKVYDGTTAAAINTNNAVLLGVQSGDDVTLILTNATGQFDNKNVGTNKAVTIFGLQLAGADAGKYALPDPTTNANISVATLAVSATAPNKLYDGTTAASVTLSDNRVSGDVLTVSYTNAVFSDQNVANGKTVTVSGISVTGPDAANYIHNSTATTTADITQRPLAVTADAKSKTYGDADPALTYQLTSGSLVSPDNFSGALTRIAGENAGTYAILQGTLTASANYSLSYTGANLTITPRSLLAQADNKTRAYGVTNPPLTITFTGFIGSEGPTNLAQLPVASTTADTNSPVGAYEITLTGGSDANYSLTLSNGTLSVTSYALTLTADNQSRSYGATNPPLTGTLTGVQNGDNITASYSTAADITSPIGNYTILASLNDPGNKLTNYSVTLSNGTLSVTSAVLTVTADPQSKLYGDADPAFTYQITSGELFNGDTLAGALTRVAGEGAGTYAIQQGTLAATTNYSLTYIGANLTILPIPLTVTADPQTKVYGQADPALTYQLSSGAFLNGDGFSGALALVAGENAGTYAILQGTLTAGTNYAINYIGADLTITAGDSALVVASSANPSPTGSNVTFTATLSAVSPASGTPSGAVQFVVDGFDFGAPATLSGGVASVTTAALSHGYHTVDAEYAGDGNFHGSTNSLGTNELINTSPVAINSNLAALMNQSVSMSASKLARRGTDADGDTLFVSAVSTSSDQGGTVALGGGFITYTPPTNYTGADQFTYTISDPFGATADGTIAVTVSAANVSSVITSITQQPDGNMEIMSSGIPGATYWIQASTDLAAWTTIGTNTADTNGIILFLDQNATNYTSRFYRTAAP